MNNNSLFEYDRALRERYGVYLCGVDEAGRGPLAGPVVVAAVILPNDFTVDELNDSKKMTEKQRDKVFELIQEYALSYSIVSVDSSIIDEINILKATLYGMSKAVEDLSIKPTFTIIDGNDVPLDLSNAKAIVKGDTFSASISAASVLAKVTRDRFMREISNEYKEYNFAKHKGYATKEHYESIKEYGLTPMHRRSFFTKSNRYFNIDQLYNVEKK